MKASRIIAIEKYIHTHGSVSLDELCDVFTVSKNTIRRDIQLILKKGTITKVYGGVQAVDVAPLKPYTERNVVAAADKDKIAALAAQHIEPGDFVYIDSGTTTRHLIDYLEADIACTVLTNNLDIMNACADRSNITLHTIGNTFKQPTRSFVGINLSETIQHYNITKAFMAATAVSLTAGVTNSDLLEYDIKKNIVAVANEVLLLADATKFDKATLLTYAPLNAIDTVITSATVPANYLAYFKAQTITVEQVAD